MIVGKAAMKANDRFKSTPFGFLTHQIQVSNIRVPKDQLEYKSEKCLLLVIDQHGKLRATNAFCDQIEQVTAWNLIPPILDSNERIQGWSPLVDNELRSISLTRDGRAIFTPPNIFYRYGIVLHIIGDRKEELTKKIIKDSNGFLK